MGVGFSDQEYLNSGATLQSAKDIYKDKDLIIKFKGPSLASIAEMRPGCTLLCMAHFGSFPDRARILEEHKINVIAMEEIVEAPKFESDQSIIARTAMATALQPFLDDNTIGGLNVRVVQWTQRTLAAIRRAGNRDPRSLKVIQNDISVDQLDAEGPSSLYFFDGDDGINAEMRAHIEETGTHLFDLAAYEREKGAEAVKSWRESHPPLPFGLRRIQCLHQTGQAGARYGLELLKQNKPDLDTRDAKCSFLVMAMLRKARCASFQTKACAKSLSWGKPTPNLAG